MSTSQEHITPKKRTLVPWITAILMVVGVSVIAAIYWNKLVRVNEIEVRGTFFTTPEEVIEMAATPAKVRMFDENGTTVLGCDYHREGALRPDRIPPDSVLREDLCGWLLAPPAAQLIPRPVVPDGTFRWSTF